MDEGMECPVCWSEFNDEENTPYVLWCGHSFCKTCVVGLQTAVMKFMFLPLQLPLVITCPWCQYITPRLSWKGTLHCPCKNFFLLWILESVKGQGVRQRPKSDSPPAVGSPPWQYFNAAAMDAAPAQSSWQGRTSPGVEQQQWRQPTPPARNFLLELAQGGWDLAQWHLGIGNILAFLVQYTAKLPLVFLFMFIILCVVPFSAMILAIYTFLTVVFALPSILAVYLAYPSLGWLAREIAT